jgi:hypothetical protein
MLLTKLLHSTIHSGKILGLTSAVVAILALVVGNSIALADKPARTIPSSIPSGKIAGEVYLYGESDRPEVIGKEYIIFETIGSKTVGAFYLPRSEFSCFYGQFRGSKLNITLIDTYDSQKYKFSLALNPNGLTASKQPMMGTPAYQPLGKIGANDRRILDACKVQLRGQY